MAEHRTINLTRSRATVPEENVSSWGQRSKHIKTCKKNEREKMEERETRTGGREMRQQLGFTVLENMNKYLFSIDCVYEYRS